VWEYTHEKVKEELLVILVLYEMPLSESAAFLSLSRALRQTRGSLFVYDNSSREQSLASEKWDISYRHDPSNPGVSKAFNEGFKRAKELNKKWLLLADQDTVFPENVFEKYFYGIEKSSAEVLVPVLEDQKGMVSPLKFYWGGGQRVKWLDREAILPLREYFFHNSGLLVSTHAFETSGGYDERLPLDFSDFSFAKRLQKNFPFFYVLDVVCHHDLASTSPQAFDRRLSRFKQYKNSALVFNKEYRVSALLMPRVFFRAIKLSWQYRTLKFIFSYFEGR
jgi:GT2 family glycosyltransferase